jgi:ABC-type branched-subunit amino acid transport system substrate-binding protein
VNIHHAQPVGEGWDEVRSELERAFQMSRSAARAGESFVFVVHHDDLLGRRGAGNAMVATGLLSAARTAAIEGSRKGWSVNVVAFDDDADPEVVRRWAERLAEDSDGVTGELIRLGSSHLGKALP